MPSLQLRRSTSLGSLAETRAHLENIVHGAVLDERDKVSRGRGTPPLSALAEVPETAVQYNTHSYESSQPTGRLFKPPKQRVSISSSPADPLPSPSFGSSHRTPSKHRCFIFGCEMYSSSGEEISNLFGGRLRRVSGLLEEGNDETAFKYL